MEPYTGNRLYCNIESYIYQYCIWKGIFFVSAKYVVQPPFIGIGVHRDKTSIISALQIQIFLSHGGTQVFLIQNPFTTKWAEEGVLLTCTDFSSESAHTTMSLT